MSFTRYFRDRKCTECAYYGEEHDGEYGEIFCGSSCDLFPAFGNLKSFPFKNEQACFVPDLWFTPHAKLVDGSGEDMGMNKAMEAWSAEWGGKVKRLCQERDARNGALGADG